MGAGPAGAVPGERLEQELESLLEGLRNKSRPGLGWIKRATKRIPDMALRDGVALEIQSFAEFVATSSHPREGIQAFRERRQPRF